MDRDERNQLKEEGSNEYIMKQFMERISRMMTEMNKGKEKP